jgi:phospholipid transport system transporter-binding protein
MFLSPPSITVADASVALKAGLAAIDSGETCFDLAPLVNADSAAVATMLGWQRAAHNKKLALHFTNLPANVQSLMQMYGVAELLATAA